MLKLNVSIISSPNATLQQAAPPKTLTPIIHINSALHDNDDVSCLPRSDINFDSEIHSTNDVIVHVAGANSR